MTTRVGPLPLQQYWVAVVGALLLVTLHSSESFSIQPRRLLLHAARPFSISTSSSTTTTTFTTTTQLDVTSKNGPMACRPIGIGSAVPTTRLTNACLESVVETTDEWIQSRTGIAARRVLVTSDVAATTATTTTTTHQSLRDLSVAAAQAALDMAQVSATDIDVVICCTSSPDDLFGDAPTIASTLGCSTNTVAFDLTAACSGFLFGVITAGTFLSSPSSSTQRALVIGADALSRWVDWDDRNACILFGDGAGAMVLERCDATDADAAADASKSFGILGYAAHSNGQGHNDLNLEYKGSPRKIDTPGEGTILSSGSYGKMHMNGKEVYKFATSRVPEVLQECLTAADMTIDQVDWLLLHQANRRIMESVASRLGLPMEKVICNLQDYGNTSAASIPLALDEAVRSGKVKSGDVIACAGFGAGLSWGAAILRWS